MNLWRSGRLDALSKHDKRNQSLTTRGAWRVAIHLFAGIQSRHRFLSKSHALPPRRMLSQGGFNFPRLNAETSDFDLIVGPTDELDDSIRTVACSIAR